FLPQSRIIILLPATLWFLTFVLADAHRPRVPNWLTARRTVFFVAALGLLTFNLRSIDYSNRVLALRDQAVARTSGNFQRTSDLLDGCKRVQRFAREAGTD